MERSPKIVEVTWGKLVVEKIGEFKDAKLLPGGAIEWDWRLTDLHHVPGIQPEDVECFLDAQATHVVLSRGMQLVLRTQQRTINWLEERGIEVFVEETRCAAKRYNELSEQGVAVGALIHSTC